MKIEGRPQPFLSYRMYDFKVNARKPTKAQMKENKRMMKAINDQTPEGTAIIEKFKTAFGYVDGQKPKFFEVASTYRSSHTFKSCNIYDSKRRMVDIHEVDESNESDDW